MKNINIINILGLIISLAGISLCLFIFYFDNKPYYEGYFYMPIFIWVLYSAIKDMFYE